MSDIQGELEVYFTEKEQELSEETKQIVKEFPSILKRRGKVKKNKFFII